MRPNKDTVVYRPDLGDVVKDYILSESTNIGLQLMPLYPTMEKAATFPVIPKEALMKIPDTSRAPRGRYNRGDWEYERGKYGTTEHGWEEPMDDDERLLLDGETNSGVADSVATDRAWDIIMRSQEKRIADMIFNATNFTANAVSNEWDDATNATPIDDVNDAKLSVRSACGMLPNTLVITYPTFIQLKNCDQIVSRLKYTFPGIDLNRMTSAQLAAIFDIPQVLVAGTMYDSAKKGLDLSLSELWSTEYAFLTRVATRRDLTEPCLGRTFVWTADSASNPIVETYREEQSRSDIYRVRHNTDERLLKSETDAGVAQTNIAQAVSYLFSNITA